MAFMNLVFANRRRNLCAHDQDVVSYVAGNTVVRFDSPFILRAALPQHMAVSLWLTVRVSIDCGYGAGDRGVASKLVSQPSPETQSLSARAAAKPRKVRVRVGSSSRPYLLSPIGRVTLRGGLWTPPHFEVRSE